MKRAFLLLLRLLEMLGGLVLWPLVCTIGAVAWCVRVAVRGTTWLFEQRHALRICRHCRAGEKWLGGDMHAVVANRRVRPGLVLMVMTRHDDRP